VPSLISAFGRLQPEAVVELYNLGSAAARRQVSTDARLLLPEESVSAEDVSIDQLVLAGSEVDATACFFGVNGVPLWLIQVLRRAARLDAASQLDDHAACSERSHVYGVLGGRCSVCISSLHLLALPPFICA